MTISSGSTRTETNHPQVQSSQTTGSPSRIETIEFLALSPHYPKVNAFSSFIGWAVIFMVLFAVDLLIEKVNLHFMVLSIIAFAAIISAVHGYFAAKACGYFRGEFELLYKEGLWWRKQTALSFSRIQHIDISHGPLERKYKMATIKFFTAGGAASDLKIPGLPTNIAELLRTEILHYAKTEFESSQSLQQHTAIKEKALVTEKINGKRGASLSSPNSESKISSGGNNG